MKFPFHRQSANNDCGPTCLKMIAEYYNRHYELDYLKKKFQIRKNGVSMLNMYKTSKAIGFLSRGVKIQVEKLKEKVQHGPAILYCNKNHFVVIYKTPKPRKKGKFYLADPANGKLIFEEFEFLKFWIGEKQNHTPKPKTTIEKKSDLKMGYALLLRPPLQ